MTDNINKLAVLASGLEDLTFEENAGKLRGLVDEGNIIPAGVVISTKSAWSELYGPDVSVWPHGLQNALKTMKAGAGLSNFDNVMAAALQGLQLEEATMPAFEAAVSVVEEFGSSSLQATLSENDWRTLKRANPNLSFIPASAARAGLSFISSPFSLIVPIWAGGIAGRAVTGLTANAGRAFLLADDAAMGTSALLGLTGEAAGFVGASRVISAGVSGNDANTFIEETFASALFFGMLKACGAAGRLIAGILPRGEAGLALARLTGHATSVLGLASTEEIQERMGNVVLANITLPSKGLIGGGSDSVHTTAFYEKLWRAVFLHAAISATNSVARVTDTPDRSRDIVRNSEALTRPLASAAALLPSAAFATNGPRINISNLFFSSGEAPPPTGPTAAETGLSETVLQSDPVYQLLKQYSEKVRFANPGRAAQMVSTAKQMAVRERFSEVDPLMNYLERLDVAFHHMDKVVRQIRAYVKRQASLGSDVIRLALKETLAVALRDSDIRMNNRFVRFLGEGVASLPARFQRAVINGTFAVLKNHEAYKAPWDKAHDWVSRSVRYYEKAREITDAQISALHVPQARAASLRERVYERVISHRDELNLNEADNQLDTAAAFISDIIWKELTVQEKGSANTITWAKTMYEFEGGEFVRFLAMFDPNPDDAAARGVPSTFVAGAKAAVLKGYLRAAIEGFAEHPNKSSFKKAMEHRVLAVKRDILKSLKERYPDRPLPYEADIMRELERYYNEGLKYLFLPGRFVELAYSRSIEQMIEQDAPPSTWRVILEAQLRFYDKTRDFLSGLLLTDVPLEERDDIILGILKGGTSSYLKVPPRGWLENIPPTIRISLVRVVSERLRPAKGPSHTFPQVKSLVQKAAAFYRDSVLWLDRFFGLAALPAARRTELRREFDKIFVKMLDGPQERITNKKGDKGARYGSGLFVWSNLYDEERPACDAVTWYKEMYSFDNGEWDSVMAFYSASAVKEPGISFTTHFEALSSAFRDLLDRAESYPKKALAKLALERKVQVFRKELKERP